MEEKQMGKKKTGSRRKKENKKIKEVKNKPIRM
jgi:hypothetical protein